jgi:hypothetical protein
VPLLRGRQRVGTAARERVLRALVGRVAHVSKARAACEWLKHNEPANHNTCNYVPANHGAARRCGRKVESWRSAFHVHVSDGTAAAPQILYICADVVVHTEHRTSNNTVKQLLSPFAKEIKK